MSWVVACGAQCGTVDAGAQSRGTRAAVARGHRGTGAQGRPLCSRNPPPPPWGVCEEVGGGWVGPIFCSFLPSHNPPPPRQGPLF